MWDEEYYDDYKTPTVDGIDGEDGWIVVQPDKGILIKRRNEFGMTQQQVADAAGIQLRQYQRLEKGERSMSSASMRIGLSICSVLKLDPYRFVERR